MKLESVKSFVLVVLIGISLILSLTLWSYQPNSERTLGGRNITNEIDVGGSSEETKRSMVKPTDIIFHTPNDYYGFIEAENRDALYEQMQNWVITNFEMTADEDDIAASDNAVELVFPDDVPMEIMNSLFTFGTEDVVFPAWSMNRVFIHFIHESKSLYLEFVSSEDNQISTAVINDTNSYEELWSMVMNIDSETLRRYIAINEDTSATYLPAGPVSLPTYSITPTDINPNLFVNILFPTPSAVRETSSQSIGEAYFTDSRQMSIFQNQMRMEYVNHVIPASEEEVMISEVDLLDRSILHINSHSGWTEDYRLEDINLQSHWVNFQLYYQGYPVFSNYKLSTIQQRWDVYQNNFQLMQYDRPLYSFESEFLLRDVDDLTSGENVVAYLANHPEIHLENIQDIKVSYELKYHRDEQESEYIELDPSWYKKENNIWQKIIFDDYSSQEGEE